MAWEEVKRKVKRQFSDLLEIPGDVLLDLPLINMVGNMQLQVENHRGIHEYTTNFVRISTGKGFIEITGENLVLRNIMSDEIILEGKIKSLSLVELE